MILTIFLENLIKKSIGIEKKCVFLQPQFDKSHVDGCDKSICTVWYVNSPNFQREDRDTNAFLLLPLCLVFGLQHIGGIG